MSDTDKDDMIIYGEFARPCMCGIKRERVCVRIASPYVCEIERGRACVRSASAPAAVEFMWLLHQVLNAL